MIDAKFASECINCNKMYIDCDCDSKSTVAYGSRELVLNKDLLWESDWDGEDVGHDNFNVVGLYRLAGTETYFYINMETNKIIEILENEDEGENDDEA